MLNNCQRTTVWKSERSYEKSILKVNYKTLLWKKFYGWIKKKYQVMLCNSNEIKNLNNNHCCKNWKERDASKMKTHLKNVIKSLKV